MPDDNMEVTEIEPRPESLPEQQMRTALRRVEAPEGFTERTMARVEALPRKHAATVRASGGRGVLLRFTQPVWRLGYAAAAVLALGSGALHVEHARAERRKAELAAAQFDAALQVTNHALNQVSASLETTPIGAVQRALEASGGDQ